MKLRASFDLVATVVLVLICGSTYGSDDVLTRDTLRGLKGMRVLISELDEEAVKDGLTKDSIKTDVELKLRLAGIRVLSEQEWLKEPGGPHLYIMVNIKKQGSRGYNYSFSVEFTQKVYLVRSPETVAFGRTWSTGAMGGTPELKGIRDGIKDYVDQFINAYLSVNPKK